MDVKDHPVISVLGEARRYMVPIYQRQYAWEHRLLKQFWEDVIAKAEEAIERRPKFQHFMGALILAPGSDGYTIGATPSLQVVDGQQRLTTFQLFIAALRHVARDNGYEDINDALATYVFNTPKSGDVGKDAKFKLVPTPADRTLFQELISVDWQVIRANHPRFFYKNGNLITGSAPRPMKAFSLFREWIERYAKLGITDPDEALPPPSEEDGKLIDTRLRALQDALLLYMKLVVITLGEDDDAQVIFETLNSKAEPLLAMDLVRNNIFHRAEAHGESAEELFVNKWSVFQDESFWKANAPRAKPKRPRIDHFLSNALTSMTGKETSLREIYSEYRAFARPRGTPRFTTVHEELDALTRFAPVYRSLEQPDNTAIGHLGQKLAIWEVAVVYPVIFQIALSPDIDDDEKATLYRLIYSYIVRRGICNLTPKNYNRNFERLSSAFIEFGVSKATFVSVFADQKADTFRFPDDDEFMVGILSKPVYSNTGRKERIVDILWELELSTRSKFQVSGERPIHLSVEHVMPYGWRAHWPLSDYSIAPERGLPASNESLNQEVALRESGLHTLGNLTLVTNFLNSSLSNGPWSAKRPKLGDSLLALNVELIKENSWDETAIQKRGKMLAERSLKIWPSVTLALEKD